MNHEALQTMRRHFSYDPVSGRLFWNDRPDSDFSQTAHRTPAQNARMWRGRYLGHEALASMTTDGYKSGNYLGRFWRAHQVIWLLHYDDLPPQLDHINGIRTDNRLTNLRAANQIINSRNRGTPKNKSGVMGVRRLQSGRFQVLLGGRCWGNYDTIRQARAAWERARDSLGFHPNHGRKISA